MYLVLNYIYLEPDLKTQVSSVNPQSASEEQFQLKLALVMSQLEYEREEQRRKVEDIKDEAKIQMAMEQSRRDEQVILNNCCIIFF